MSKVKVFVSQFLQEEWGYDFAYVRLVPDLVAWLLERRDIYRMATGAASAAFRVPLKWRPVVVDADECLEHELTGALLLGSHDTLLVQEEEFSFPEGLIPLCVLLSVYETGVVWQVDYDNVFIETHELSWEEIEA